MWIKNYSELAASPQRKIALSLIEAALDSIRTEEAIRKNLELKKGKLTIKNKNFDLKKFKKISVIGFGKVACEAAPAIEGILREKIASGAVIGNIAAPNVCQVIKTYSGTHPTPSEENFLITKNLMEIAAGAGEDDLVIVVVSGGGSAMLCWPASECFLGKKLYEDSIKSDIPIEELNVLRKHLSGLKGGGLASLLYPATVIGLIFSDVPSNQFDMVASGPTYFDPTTVNDAKKIAKKYGLKNYPFSETPKEPIYFKNVFNFPIVSNLDALRAMKNRAGELGLTSKIFSSDIAKNQKKAIEIFKSVKFKGVAIFAGEPEAAIPKRHGKGGRNQQLTLEMLSRIKDNQLFVSFASDGQDNIPVTGAIADKLTAEKAKKLKLNSKQFAVRFDAFNFFRQTKDLIFTQSTNENVSDLMILLSE
ncbi:MAG: DUF4147 domain-containing protein [Patescibacteria group bacterium]|nr:DUF4147 domain-containing protein [Patescibacteria group bacterium]